MLTVRLAEIRGVEKAQEESAPAPQAEASEEAAPAADEANGPTPEEEAEAEAKVSVRRAAGQLLTSNNVGHARLELCLSLAT